MKILSIDTSSNICGVSILDNKKLILNLDSDTGRTHSEKLMPMIEKAFQDTNLALKDIDLLVCDKGPGSFTGIRIGVATVKAFKDSLNIPCIGVSSLEALCYNTLNSDTNNYINYDKENMVCSILDCKNNNCYFALYERKDNDFECLIEPQAEDINSCLSILKNYLDDNFDNNIDLTFVGDGSETYKKEIINYFPNAHLDINLNLISSYSLGLAGLKYYNNNIFQDVLPLYLKKPQAQIQLEDKLKNKEL